MLFVLLNFGAELWAVDNRAIKNQDGEIVFVLRFFDTSDGNFGDGNTSTQNFTETEKLAVMRAAQYWVDMTKPTGEMPAAIDQFGNVIKDANGDVVRQPVVINVGTIDYENAYGSQLDSVAIDDSDFVTSRSMILLADGTSVYGAYHGIMAIGTKHFVASDKTLNQVSWTAKDITSVTIHEFGHILGITSPMEYGDPDYDRMVYEINFPDILTRWQSFLRDSNGKSAVPGAYPDPAAKGKPVDYDPTGGGEYIFDMGDPNSDTQPADFTFVGQNAMEVYYDGNSKLIDQKTKEGKGVPLLGLVPNSYYLLGIEDADKWMYNNPNTMSHTNLHNSLMSWQQYRNYPMMLEVELAMMQDLGYNINRKDFFGRSFYVDGDGTQIANSTGFNSLNPYGVGLHMFAKDLDILQTASIQAKGPGAAGIRIDGVANTLTIAPTARISAGLAKGTKIDANRVDSYRNYGVNIADDGTLLNDIGAVGLLVAYGKDHHIVHRGSIETYGLGGVGARFDFGVPMMGAHLGSYAYHPDYKYMEEGNLEGGYPEELNGALVNNFDVTGIIKGGSMGSGTPIITKGGSDRIITRGDDDDAYIFTHDPYYDEIIRIFEDGQLVVPSVPIPAYDYPKMDAGSSNEANESQLSAVFTNVNDGTTVIFFESSTPERAGVDKHLYLVDPTFYDVNEKNYYDNQGILTHTEITVTHKGDGTTLTLTVHPEKDGGQKSVRVSDTDSYVISQGYTPDNPIPTISVIIYETGPNGERIYDIKDIVQRPNSTPVAPNAPGLLENYDVGYLDDWYGTSYSGRVLSGLFVRSTEDNPNAPWLNFFAPDQDIVTFNREVGAAIYIAGHVYDQETGLIQGGSHVEYINIMNGASIEGDIVSHYNSLSLPDEVATRGTTITFGHKADSSGKVTSAADSNFSFIYRDNINFYETAMRAYINDRPEFGDDDIRRWGSYNYDEETGEYVYVGYGQGRYNLTDSWFDAGKIDLHFVGGYTEFQVNPDANKINRHFVDSVLIDHGATFSLGASLNIDSDGNYNFNSPTVLTKGSFVNQGRFSGEGTVMVDAQKSYVIEWIDDELYALIPVGYTANGTLVNQGTIAPGPNNGYGELNSYLSGNTNYGRRVGSLAIAGNLDLSHKNSVYEVTISDGRNVTSQTPDWDVHPDWTVDPESGALVLDWPDRTTPWYIDPDSGLPIYNEQDIIGGGWGAGASDRLVVSGSTKLGGTLRVNVTPGYYSTDPTVYTIIRSEGGYTGNFENVEHYIGFLTFKPYNLNASDTYINGKDLQFTVIRDPDYFKKHAVTENEVATATAIDQSMFHSYNVAFSLSDNRNSQSTIRNMYHQLAGSVRANSLMMNLWSPSEVIFNRIGWGNGQMRTDNRGIPNRERTRRNMQRILGQSPYSKRSGSVWGDVLHTSFSAEGDGNSDEYKFNRTGFLIGSEWNLTQYSAIGAIAAYGNGKLKQTGDKVDSDDYVLGLYFVAAPYNQFEIKTYLGFGIQEYDMDRTISNSSLYYNGKYGVHEQHKSDAKGNSLNFSFEVARPFMLHPTFILRPTLGIDVQHVWQRGFTERNYDGGIYGLRFDKSHVDRSLLRAGFSSESSGARGSFRMRAFYVTDLTGEGYPTSNQYFASGGEQFTVRGVDIGKNFLNLGVGANLWTDGEHSSSLFFDYDANIYNCSQKVYVHSISLGFVQNF